jgi:hypothetical protein
MSTLKRSGATVSALVLAVAGQLYALPRVGDGRPNVVVKDAWDRALDLSRVGERPLLVVYEDRASSSQNQAFKNELARVAKGPLALRVVLAAVADVQGYDYWPARGFVKDAIRSQSNAIGAPIYCDWSGAVRNALGVRRGTSTVILYDASGRVVFAHEGAMDATSRASALSLLQAAVGSQPSLQLP